MRLDTTTMQRGNFAAAENRLARAKARAAASSTAGTNQPATVSAIRWIGARLRWASATMLTIRASMVSEPIFSAFITREPVPLNVLPISLPPVSLAVGMGSPVTTDSSPPLHPSRMTPSAGTPSPGWTRSFKTEQRTGVLIFAPAVERYVKVVADSGINDKVASSVWDGAVAALVAFTKAEQPGDGFVTAIEECGAVLATHFPPGALKRDELPDKLLEL